ncbi:MAG: DUF3106 domain-containing protein [Verrucomicrobiia bacterium]|jgi:hypothetical protein
MKRFLFLAAVMMGVVAMSTLAQQPPPPPPPPPVSPQPKLKQPMTEQQRALAEQRLDTQWSRMSLDGKMHVMRLHRALTEMPPDERKFIHDRVERFLNMTPAERARLQQNKQKWEQMTPEQRQQAREEFRKRRQEFEERWNREQAGGEPQGNLPPTENNATPTPPPPPP